MRSGVRSGARSGAAKRLFRRWATLLLTGVAACVLLALVCAGLRGSAPFDSTFITLDAEPLAPSHWHGNHGLAAFGALLLGAAVLLLVVPVIVAVAVLVVVVLVAVLVMLAVLAGVLTLLGAPVFLLGGVVWLMWRLAQGRAQPGSGVTP